MVVFYIVVIVLSVWLLIKMLTPSSNSGTSASRFTHRQIRMTMVQRMAIRTDQI